MHRLILVGEAPAGLGWEPQPALEGNVGTRLSKMLDLPYVEYLERIDRRNVFEAPDSGHPWDGAAAKLSAMRTLMHLEPGARLICLGNQVSQAFGILTTPYYCWLSIVRMATGTTFEMARVPHPSGRNRRLNNRVERDRMGTFLREALSDRA